VAEGSGFGAGRSTAIVLFTDLVGSSELRSRLGENAAEELRHKHDALVAGAVQANRGHLIKNLGDGIMATFNGASDAVGASVAIQQAIGRHNRSVAAALEIRIGISAGDVVFEGDDCFGTPVIEAARLCGAAGGGQILASEMVRWLARSSEEKFTPLGSLELKGLSEPVPTVQVDWEPLPESSVPLPQFLTDIGWTFVGRDGELERLGRLWKEATVGGLRVALVAGEPGVGKTRLAAELARTVHDEGGMVLAGRCDEDLGVPYQPFVEALRHFVDHSGALPGAFGRYGGELVRLVPELGERAPGLPAPLRSDPETERYRLFDAVASWLAAVSADEPLLVVLDDLQWAAKPTLMLLRHVVRSADPVRLLVVGTYRDTELGHDHPLVDLLADLRRQGSAERLSLPGLDSAGVAAFMEQAAGHRLDGDDLALARAIHTETEGNPFFVREVLRHLAETGAIEQRDGHWARRLPVEQVGIPEGVREVVGKRLARLGDETNGLLRIAAVVGAEFESALLRMMSDLGEEQLILALDEATGARLIIEGSGGRYRFSHALVQETLYQGLSGIRRVALHRRVAEAIEMLHGDRIDDHLAALAHHYARASAPAAQTDKAIDYAARAGGHALARLAPDEAARWYEQALELDAHDQKTDLRRRSELLVGLGESQRQAGQPTFRETLLQAARLARQLGDKELLVRAALANNRGFFSTAGRVDPERVEMLEAAIAALGDEDSISRARLLATVAAELTFSGEWTRRRQLADDALAVARRVGDAPTLSRVLNLRQMTIQVPDTLRERLRETTENLELTARLGDPTERFWACEVRLRALVESGQADEAARWLGEMDRLADELSQPTLRWFVAWHRFCLVYLAGRLEEAEQTAIEALQIGNDGGEPDAVMIYGAEIAMVRLDQGRLGELAPLVEQAVADNPGLPSFRPLLAICYLESNRLDDARHLFASDAANGFSDMPYDLVWAAGLGLWAHVCAALGDINAATVLLEKLQPAAGTLSYTGATAWGAVDRYLGLLCTTLRRFEEAENYFAAAVRFHEDIGAPVWLARTRLDWAAMLLARRHPGDAERARELLGQALVTARELALANLERRAVQLLASQ
jgi:class 3 adenylate cyclase/tetratricopeptide (TPR) repeat protein